MFSTAKKMTVFGVILSLFSAVGAILLLCSLPAINLNFTLFFSIMLLVVTAVASIVLLVFGLRSLCQDLDLYYENTSERLHDMQKKIEELDARTKQ